MTEKGRVVSIEGGVARVELEETPECRRCGACMCSGGGRMLADVDAVPGLQPGHAVLLEGLEKTWSASLVLMVLPVASLLAGVVLGQVLAFAGLPAETCSMVLGVGLFILALAAGFAWEHFIRPRRRRPRPRIVMFYDP